MLTYIIRRLLLMIPTLIGVTMLVFFIMSKAPGGFESALDEGNQAPGAETRRIRQEITNRYALDQPIYVQYARWLNQVSPIGFEMTGDYEWPDKEREAVYDALGGKPWVANDRERGEMRDLILTIAIYADKEPVEVIEMFDAAADDPVPELVPGKSSSKKRPKGPAADLFDLIDAEPLKETFWEELAETRGQEGQAAAVEAMFAELGYSSIKKSRMRFDAIKLWDSDLGTDKNNRNVGELILERLPITLVMNIISVPLIYVISIVAGVLAARRRGGVFDVASGGFMLGLYSVPVILTGTLLIAYLANSDYLRWFPASGLHDLQADKMPFLPYTRDGELYRGYLLDFAWHLVLPVLCLTYTGFAFLTKVMRGSVLETISADFVRTARAKGVAEKHILFRHVLRNSLLPLITIVATLLPSLFVGSFVVEYIFSIQGMGLLTIEAAKNADVNIVMATTLVGSLLMLFSLILRDILYAIADPRVTYD